MKIITMIIESAITRAAVYAASGYLDRARHHRCPHVGRGWPCGSIGRAWPDSREHQARSGRPASCVGRRRRLPRARAKHDRDADG